MAPRKEATRLTHFSEQPRWPRTPSPPSSPQSTSTTSSQSPLPRTGTHPLGIATMNPAMNNLVISLAAMQGLSAPAHSASAPNAHRARPAAGPFRLARVQYSACAVREQWRRGCRSRTRRCSSTCALRTSRPRPSSLRCTTTSRSRCVRPAVCDLCRRLI